MSLHGGTQMDSKQAARAVIFERKLLFACLWMAAVSLMTWLASISTNYWYVSRCTAGAVQQNTGLPDVTRASLLSGHAGLLSGHASLLSGHASLLSGHAGLWKTCKTVLDNDTHSPGQAYVITACRTHRLSSIPELPADHPMNVMIGYWRTSVAFSALSVLLQLMAIFCSWYSLKVPRYTFKRLTGCMYIICAGVKLVVIQVQEAVVKTERIVGSTMGDPRYCTWNYSFSFIMALVCLITNIVCAVCVFYTSGKKKKVHALTLRHDHDHDDADDGDEPVILAGR